MSGAAHTPATADVQSQGGRGGGAVQAAVPPVHPRGFPATPMHAVGVSAAPFAMSPEAHVETAGSPGAVSAAAPARPEHAPATSAGEPGSPCTSETAATPPSATAGPPSSGSGRAASPRHMMRPVATPAVAITPRAPTAGALVARSPPDEVPSMSGSPASVAYALAARAGLPTALSRPLTVAAGQAFGTVVSPAATGALATPDTSEPMQFPRFTTPAAASQPLLLTVGSRTDLASPLKTPAAPSSAGAAVPLKVAAGDGATDTAAPRIFVPTAAVGACELSRPVTPSATDDLPALPEEEAVSQAPADVSAPSGPAAAPLKVVCRRTTSGKSDSAEGSDSAGMGPEISMNVSAATLAATSGVTDEQEAALAA